MSAEQERMITKIVVYEIGTSKQFFFLFFCCIGLRQTAVWSLLPLNIFGHIIIIICYYI